MSHDRGCPCGREKWEYADCKRMKCNRRADAQAAIAKRENDKLAAKNQASPFPIQMGHMPYEYVTRTDLEEVDMVNGQRGRWVHPVANPQRKSRRHGPVGTVTSNLEEDPPLTREQRDWLFEFLDAVPEHVHHKLNAMEVHVPTKFTADSGVSDVEPQEFHLLRPVKLRASRSTHSGKYVTRWVYDYGTRPGLTVYRFAQPLRKKK